MSSSFAFYDPFQELDRFLSEALNPRVNERGCPALQRTSRGGGVFHPRMDLHENKEANTVTATFELPGLAKEHLDITVHDGQLTISGESKTSAEHEESGYSVRERKFGKFSRSIQLPQGVKEDQIKASLENGVLTVTFPKTTPEMAPKRVSIA